MKKYIFILIVALIFSSGSFAQEVIRVQNGAVVSIQADATLNIAGGITMENGSTLTNNGTITLVKNTLSGLADWIDNSATAYSYGTGTIVLNSSNNQTLNFKNTIEQINVNSAAVNLASDITANKWYLISGPVNTGSFKAIALSNSQLAVEADPANPNFSNSWFNGVLRRFVSTSTVNNYNFPVGNATQSNLITLDNLQTNPLNNLSYFDASFNPKPGSDLGLTATEDGIVYSAVNTAGVWHLTPDLEPTTGKYDILLYFNGFTGLTDNEFAILKRPDASSNASEWIVPAGSAIPAPGAPGRIVSSGYARRNNISDFSQFGIGMTSTPLPVTLVDFEAHRQNNWLAVLNWTTVSEENNSGFGIERRFENEPSFKPVGFVSSLAPGGNSSNVLSYHFTDSNDYSGNSYYRLKQIDLDNKFVYSYIRMVTGNGQTGITVKIYPNPSQAQFSILIENTTKTYQAFITDVLGRMIKTFTITGNVNIPVTGLNAGSYVISILNLFGQNNSFTEKILVVH
jgi:hypothetical protein